MKSISTHLLTACLTLLVVMAYLRGHRPEAPWQAPVLRPVPTAGGTPPAAPDLPAAALQEVDAEEQVNIRIYETANRSVVNITTASAGGFFGDEVSTGTGSGFFIDGQGRVLTNYHVIADAEALEVTLADGKSYPARVLGSDMNIDVAVLELRGLEQATVPLPFGDSAPLRVGQKVLAIGNPFGLERTLTTGIISSLNRSIKSKNNRSIKGIIQTDAAINPGNSGGPLFNTRGEVIGMNTAILSSVGQSAGIGFAVPINVIKRVLDPLIRTGHVVRADLGIRSAFVTDDGLYIVDLDDNGPAARAGLKPIRMIIERAGRSRYRRPDPDSADRIVAINGKPVRSVDDLLTEVEAHQPGQTVTLTCVQHGKTHDLVITLGSSE